jgi:glycine betaine/proline transport system substrate-binding protein
MKVLDKKRLAAVSALAAITLCFTPPAFAKTKVILAELTWDEPKAIDAVIKVILEQKLDADVSYIAADQSAVFAAMDKGDGSVDVHPAIWSAAQDSNIIKYVKEKKTVLLNKSPYFASDGFYIPKYMSEKYNIHSVSDLTKPGIAKLFDMVGNGRGAYWPGAPGWGVTNIYQVKARSYGLDKDYDSFIVPDALLKTQLQKAYSARKGILFYYWTPEALFLQYDLIKLKEPQFDGYASEAKKGTASYNPNGCYNYTDPKQNPDWLKQSKITCESPPEPIYIGYSRSLEQRSPKIANFLSRVAIKTSDVSGWIYELTVNHKTPDQMATEWVGKNEQRVQEWLGN